MLSGFILVYILATYFCLHLRLKLALLNIGVPLIHRFTNFRYVEHRKYGDLGSITIEYGSTGWKLVVTGNMPDWRTGNIIKGCETDIVLHKARLTLKDFDIPDLLITFEPCRKALI